MKRHALFGLLLVAACDGPVADLPRQGYGNFCLTRNDASPPSPSPSTDSVDVWGPKDWAYAVTGHVIATGESVEVCGDRPASFLAVRDEQGAIWKVHWNVISSAGGLRRPKFDVAAGNRVELFASYSTREWIGVSSVFRLQDDRGLVFAYALEDGDFAPKPPERARFSVERGEKVDGDSGVNASGLNVDWALYAIVFRGDTAVAVGPDDEKAFEAGSCEYIARNIHSYLIDISPCSDCGGRSGSWLVWRQ